MNKTCTACGHTEACPDCVTNLSEAELYRHKFEATAHLRQQLKEAEDKHLAYETTIATLKVRLRNVEHEGDTLWKLQRERTALANSLDSTTEEMQQLRQEVQKIKGEVHQPNDEVQQLKAEVQRLTALVNEPVDSTVKRLTEQVLKLSEELLIASKEREYLEGILNEDHEPRDRATLDEQASLITAMMLENEQVTKDLEYQRTAVKQLNQALIRLDLEKKELANELYAVQHPPRV